YLEINGLRSQPESIAPLVGRKPPLPVDFNHASHPADVRAIFACVACGSFIESPTHHSRIAPSCAETARPAARLREHELVMPGRTLSSLEAFYEQTARFGCLAIVLLRAVTGRTQFRVAAELDLLSGMERDDPPQRDAQS